MKQVYLAHPFTDGMSLHDIDGTRNLELAKRWYRWCCKHHSRDRHFNIMWVLDIEIYNANMLDNGLVTETEESRRKGMEINYNRISSCDELWLTGVKVTKGMEGEAIFAQRCGLKVYDITTETGLGGIPYSIPAEKFPLWKHGSLTEQVGGVKCP